MRDQEGAPATRDRGPSGATWPSGRKVAFIGFMGAGKTRAARRAAAIAGVEALDSDALLEAEAGEPIARQFERGEVAFRDREEALVLELLERPDAPIVSLGGGAVTSQRVRDELRSHVSVFLDVEGDLAWARAERSQRPLARRREAFLELLEERRPLYESVARAVVPSEPDGAPEPALRAAIALASRDVPETVRMLWGRTRDGGYAVYAGDGALEAIAALWPGAGRAFVIADERALALHGGRVRASLEAAAAIGGVEAFPPGELRKTLGEARRLLGELARSGMEREDTLVALGGGVAGDLAGFCAAVYQRGVAIVHVPTTLVAQVDSAYGGKTGVDLPEAKNYVGAFHQPAAVFTDPSALATLPSEELRAGFAEVVKTALIAGEPLWGQVRSLRALDEEVGGEALALVIERCARTKLAIVGVDERDRGERAVLNLGHTFAHALEAAQGYTGVRHGEAVALGLLVALRLSERHLGLDPSVRSEVAEVLRRHGLATAFDGPPSDELLRRAALDKKRRGGRHRMVLLRAPGHAVTGVEVADGELSEAIEEIRER